MKINKHNFLSIGVIVGASLVSFNSLAQTPKELSQNQQIVDTLFSNQSPEAKAKIAKQIKDYSYIQYGIGKTDVVTVPKSPQDLSKNIKSFDHATVTSNLEKIRKSMEEIPKLEKVSTSKMKP